MKYLIALLLTVSLTAHSQIQQGGQRGTSRVVNNTGYFMVCELLLTNGRTVYWELYPGQATPWYYIRAWRCG